jgi:hypothetical protein
MSFPISTDIFGQLKWLIKQVKLLIFKTSRLQNAGTYKTYVAALIQSGASNPGYYTNQSAGPGLTIGVTYSITDGINGNDDFTNVGAPAGEIYPVFVATGTTPNVWDSSTRTYFDTGAPVVTAILENTIGDITWSYLGVGQYIGTLTNAFTQDKTYVNSTNSCTVIDSFLIGSIVVFPLDVDRIYIITTQNPGSEFRDDIFGAAGNIIEIRVYD